MTTPEIRILAFAGFALVVWLTTLVLASVVL